MSSVVENVVVDRFADVDIIRYQIPKWESLTLKEQKLVYCLTMAGLSGRDIFWDQNYRYNLTIRRALENVYRVGLTSGSAGAGSLIRLLMSVL